MISGLVGGLARSALFSLDPETAHGLTIKALASGLMPGCAPGGDGRLAVNLFDLTFPNPLGMAAGFDKNGEVPDAVLKLGFGFTEAGTVTPLAQAGNPKPRVFRLVEDHGVINRYGFNNEGHAAMYERLAARRHRGGIVGVNVGANKDASDRIADYVAGVERFADLASYFTVNVSSPNTPGLRDLQAREALAELLARSLAARDAAVQRVGRKVPVLLKIAPDIDAASQEEIAEEVLSSGVDGLIVSNTTIVRDGLRDQATAKQAGGLSGRPLFRKSTIVLARMRKLVGPDLPIIGVGGIDSPESAWTKIAAGATLIQLYTGLVYEGPGLVARILKHLSRQLDAHGLKSISEASGVNRDAWARLGEEAE
ncbi:quinone-dependent dihydroorotate dehydrogenase [Stappia sp. F7233]|uniref:Dihydroorotate dehydrogenase (quinone) n=1 Tax=Stappia albiluteola TaxID=2758565 RepID=A0A839AJH7_9HYPH|nr:quinone-dependent dihydroorotate dehydrogenase [Stappia albiluteola]MBA5779188.1 quinone-dependent dihydroorotate dehydrogenase [Stappia albiluteola]